MVEDDFHTLGSEPAQVAPPLYAPRCTEDPEAQQDPEREGRVVPLCVILKMKTGKSSISNTVNCSEPHDGAPRKPGLVVRVHENLERVVCARFKYALDCRIFEDALVCVNGSKTASAYATARPRARAAGAQPTYRSKRRTTCL